MFQRNKGHQVHHMPSQARRFHVCHGNQFTKLYVVIVVEQEKIVIQMKQLSTMLEQSASEMVI